MNYFFQKPKPPLRVNYEDIQLAQTSVDMIIISTLPNDEQSILIHKTVPSINEIHAVEHAIQYRKNIIIYGKHSNDDKIYEQYDKITKLGGNASIYVGGLFEWLLLQDIYGEKDFPTTNIELDILKYKPNKVLNIPLLEY